MNGNYVNGFLLMEYFFVKKFGFNGYFQIYFSLELGWKKSGASLGT